MVSKVLALFFALAAMALYLVLFRGNLLVLAPVLGTWLYTILVSILVGSASTQTRASRLKKKAIKKDIAPRIHLMAASIVVWCLCVLNTWHRIHDVPVAFPDDTDAAQQMAKAEQLFQSGQFESALFAFKSVDIPETSPRRCAQKYHNIGVLSMRLEQWAEAEQGFHTALEYDSANFDAYYNLARLSLRNKDAEKAKRHLTAAAKIDPKHPGCRYLLAKCHIEGGDLVQAFAELESADAVTQAGHPLKPAIRNLKDQIRRVSVSR